MMRGVTAVTRLGASHCERQQQGEGDEDGGAAHDAAWPVNVWLIRSGVKAAM